MADHSELKRLAEACGTLNWRFQQENWTEYAIRDDHGYIATMRVGSPKRAGPDPDREAKAKFLGAMTPAAVLGLIADLDEARNGMKHSCAIRLKKQIEHLETERDQLKAEIAGLKTGFEAYEQVNAGLKAEVEGLQKELAARHPFRFAVDTPVLGYTGCVICGEFTDHQGLPCPKRVVFAMAKGE